MKKIILILAIGQFFLFSSCIMLIARNNYTIKKGAIPPDFEKENTTVLFISTGRKGVDKSLKDNLKALYHGKYEFINLSELKTEKYTDLKIYRYTFIYNQKTLTLTDAKSLSKNYSYTNKFFMFDRKENKEYDCGLFAGNYNGLIKGYLKNMEKVRFKN